MSYLNKLKMEKQNIQTEITSFCLMGPGQILLMSNSFAISAILVAEERNLARAKFGNEEQNYDKFFLLQLSV